jgi:hypothetical protein
MTTNFQGIWPDGWVVRWRSLTWKEFESFRYSSQTDIEKYGAVYKLCVVAGPSLDQAPAGLVEWVGKQQLTASPFTGEFSAIQRAIALKRERFASSYLQSAKAQVACLFRYTFEEIENMTPDAFFECIAAAEVILGQPLDPADPNAVQKNPIDAKREAKQAIREQKRKEIEEKKFRWSKA